MNFTEILKKIKPKLMLLALTMLLVIPVAFYNPITAYAEDSDDNSDHHNTDDQYIVDGDGSGERWDSPGAYKGGWLVYTVSTKNLETGGAVVNSKVVYVSSTGTRLNPTWNDTYLKARIPKLAEVDLNEPHLFGGNYTTAYPEPIIYANAPWGPLIESGTQLSREHEIDTYMSSKIYMEEIGREVPQLLKVVLDYLGPAAAQELLTYPDKTYLILEPVSYHAATAGLAEGQRMVATANGWMQYQAENNRAFNDGIFSYYNEIGVQVNSSFPVQQDASWHDNRALQYHGHLNEQWDGLPDPVSLYHAGDPIIGNVELLNRERISNITATQTNPELGLGMLAYRLDNPAINTYDGTNSPGPAEDPITSNKSGLCTIVKGYITTTQTLNQEGAPMGAPTTTSDGVYVTQNTSNIINVMAEPDYELKSWHISNTLTSDLDPLNWNPPEIIYTAGNRASQQILNTNNGEKVIYLLLEKTVTTTVDTPTPPEHATPTLTISESRLTKRTWLSEFGDINWYRDDGRDIAGIMYDGEIIHYDKNILDIEFNWALFPHYTSTTCPGHTWYHSSSTDCNNGSWGSCDCDYCGDCGSNHNGMGHDSSTTKDCLRHLKVLFFCTSFLDRHI